MVLHLFQFPLPGLPVVALFLQIPLAGLAFVVEWNQRKKRAISPREPIAARRPEAERPVARLPQRPAAPSVEPSPPLVGPAPEAQPELPSERAGAEAQVTGPPAEHEGAAEGTAAERLELPEVPPAEVTPEPPRELREGPVEPQRRQP